MERRFESFGAILFYPCFKYVLKDVLGALYPLRG